MEIEIHCPYHAKTEKIELPDGYYNFEGEVACGTPGGVSTTTVLRLKLAGGKPVAVERAVLGK